MKETSTSQSGASNLRPLLCCILCFGGLLLATFGFVDAAPASLKSRARNVGPIRAITPLNTMSGPGWSVVSSPNGSTDQWNFLVNVVCLSTSDCWAVGARRNDAGFYQTLSQHWDGRSWTIVESPNQNATGSNFIEDVSCVFANDCWAVGNYYNGTAYQTLIERWDGHSWSVVMSPNNSSQDNYLDGVTCSSASDCWAVGSYSNGSGDQTLIERWDGTSWSIVPSPSGSQESALLGVTCISGSDCWAVGGNGLGATTALTEHWDGSSWSIVPTPTAATSTALHGIACRSASECWAVGMYYTGYGDPLYLTSSQTLIERWDGVSWSMVPSQNPGPQYDHLASISCPSASECWAVGSYENSSNITYALIERWDGVSWSTVAAPNKSFDGNLIGLGCVSSLQCWAVGQYISTTLVPAVSQTLIEEYAPTVPPLTSAVSRMDHSSVGMFDVDLPVSGESGVECRNGGGNYAVVFTFVNDVTDCGSAGTRGATVTPGPGTNQCTESLTGVSNAQYIDVGLNTVIDSQNNTGNVFVPMGILIGDTNGDGFVNSADISQTKSQSGNTVTLSNFRQDINADGFINSADISFVKSKSGTALPSSP
jgi:Dockerin type I domain